ncbi:UNVERIFIED_CONTAM: Dehydration-responsive element-binding protein 1B [Sesamum angustifolium]|uniref:Dehydration-responsive element-binding protein 1B n=1 Tax=Sesamum angustifolium TaxID=2727405 RepID=A0AAW2LHN4_9LAMI
MQMFAGYYTETIPRVQDFWSATTSSAESSSETGGKEKVPGDEAPRVPRSAAAELREVGMRSEGAQQEIKNLAGDFPHCGDGGACARVRAMAFRGRSACLNFADSAWRLPVPASADAKDIRKAAAEAAEAFRPQPGEERREEGSGGGGREDDGWFMDEEAVFGMHGLLEEMAEGLMLPPPQYIDDVDVVADVSLWSYSI